jgi:hypothetical protein
MRREEIDGVRIVHRDVPGEYHGTLVFGVGARDEGIDHIGLSRFVIELVVDAVSTEADFQSGLLDTMIIASGGPEDVAAHFSECCDAISALPLERMGGVARAADPGDRPIDLRLEADGVGDPWASLLARRLGTAGPGVVRWPPVDYGEFTAAEVRSHLARYFTAQNAVLALSGPPPDSLRLRLPVGSAITRAAVASPAQSGPGWSGPGWWADEVVAPGIAITGTPGPEAQLALYLLADRVRRAVDGYWVSDWYVPVDDTRIELGLGLEPKKGKNPEPAAAARLLWQEIRRLAVEPPERAEIDAIIAWWHTPVEVAARSPKLDGLLASAEHLRREGMLTIAAKQALLPVCDEFSDEDFTRAAEISPSEVSTAVARWMDSAAVVVPTGTEPEIRGLTRRSCPVSAFTPKGEVLRPSMWSRLKGTAADQLVLGDDAVHLVGGDGNVHTFPMADAIVLTGSKKTLIGNVKHGCLVNISRFGQLDKVSDRMPPRRHRLIPE